MDVHPTKNVSIGIDPYPFGFKSMADSKRFAAQIWSNDSTSRDQLDLPMVSILTCILCFHVFFILLDGLATGVKSASLYSRSLKISPGTSSSRSSFWTIWRRHTTDTVGVVWRAVVELIISYNDIFEQFWAYILYIIYIYIYNIYMRIYIYMYYIYIYIYTLYHIYIDILAD